MTEPQSSTARNFGVCLGCLFSLYMVSVFFAASVFNWQYAKKHGFVRWLLLGEIVATAKAFVWPLYAFGGKNSDRPKFTKREKKELEHFGRSITSFRDPQRHKALLDRTPAALLRLLKKAHAECLKVSDATLAKLHEPLPTHYRNEYQTGLALMIAADERKDIAMLHAGRRLAEKFTAYYDDEFMPVMEDKYNVEPYRDD